MAAPITIYALGNSLQLKKKATKIRHPAIFDRSSTHVFYDGASQGNPNQSGVGGIFKHKDHTITFQRGSRHNTSNYAEL